MPKLLFTTSSFNLDNCFDRNSLEEAGFEIIVNPYGRRLTESEVTELLDSDVVGMIAGVEPLSKSVLLAAKSLKVIARCGVGLDNVDMDAADAQGISVFNTPDAPSSAVAELTMAHILSLSRHVLSADRAMRAGGWQPVMGRLLAHQTVGIIGFGRIGQKVAKLLQGFGSNVLVHDAMPSQLVGGVEYVGLDQLLSQSDVISLHIPYTSATHHIIDARALSLMKSSALLINVARGGLIDENALQLALETGQISGAALDCFMDEPYSGPLLSCANIQLTAHMGSYARETRDIMEAEACSALVRGLKQHQLF